MSSFGAASSARKALLRASNRRSATLVAHSMPSDSKLMTVRTRFAPSPTGFLHIGGLRTALFCWLYARRHAGEFVLRIEDTDVERSTSEAIQQILDGMEWAGLEHDEGPFYQTKRFDRYQEVVEELLAQGHAYRCYCTKEELDQMRTEQMARGEKPRYDGRWRDRTDSTALFLASRTGQNEVQTLLAKGADVNAKTNNGATALMAATIRGHANV